MCTFVDLATGKIVGAKRGSLVWYHEKGHIVFNKSEHGMNNDFSRESMKTLTIVFSMLGHFHWFFVFFAVLYFLAWFYYSIYEEIWAWGYAFTHQPKRKRTFVKKTKAL